MKKIIEDYHKDFQTLLNSVRVTGRHGANLGFTSGIEATCNLIKRRSDAGGKIFFIGNGGSAAIANHMAIDFWKNAGIKSMSFSDSSLLTCLSNDFGYEHVFSKPIEFFAERNDILFTISSSGQSRNILKAIAAADLKDAAVITLSGFAKDNPSSSKGVCNFYVPSREYGLVEVAHQYICHCIADMLIKRK